MAMLADAVEVVIDVDTRNHTHTAAVLAAATGQALAQPDRARHPRRLPAAAGVGRSATTAATLRSLAYRIRELTSGAATHRQAILVLVRARRPDLLARPGVGPIVAATVLCAWSHPGRCRSDATFAMLGGAAPIPASSGRPAQPGPVPRGPEQATNRPGNPAYATAAAPKPRPTARSNAA